MKDNFEPTLQFILKAEGGYTVDHAGATKMGLTIGTMKALNLDLDHDGDVDENDVKLISADIVRAAFLKEYWNRIGADKIPAGLDLLAADFAYNGGPRAATTILYVGNIADYTIQRMLFYKALWQKNPKRCLKYKDGWVNRCLDAWQRAAELQAEVKSPNP